ncbi:MAG TPA: GDP-mannose 4,6-dehydratase [Caulobacteraceae bacterium]|nr:GDP-mannose 4,6-dehydratase [Caulobacteraceae bacterium]
MSEPKSILLTGAAGFVGGHLRPALESRFPKARRTAAVLEPSTIAGWETVVCDLTDAAAAEKLVRAAAPDVVIHLAGQASAGEAAGAVAATWRANFVASLNLAAASAEAAPQAAFLFVSSAELYGANLADGPATEETPIAPRNVYARTKAAAEAMLADVLAPPARLIIARPFNHTGAGQDERFVIPAFAAQVARIESGEQPPVMAVGNLAARIDFLDVRDVVEAYVRLVERSGEVELPAVFNIASGAPVALQNALDKLLAMAKRPIEVRTDQARWRPLETPVASGDAAKLRRLTGWSPRIPFDDTLASVLDHYRALVSLRERRGPAECG